MWRRIALAAVALAQLEVGLWGELAPRGFYRTFPGVLGQHWVAMLGPYNEHLVRDFAAAELGFAVLLGAAAIWFERRLVLVACAAFLTFTVPHFVYHLTTTTAMSTAANATSLGGFAIEIAAVVAVLVSVARPADTRSPARKETPDGPFARGRAART
jgi:hypothetical protein